MGWSLTASPFTICTVLSSSDLLGFSEAPEEKCDCGGGRETQRRDNQPGFCLEGHEAELWHQKPLRRSKKGTESAGHGVPGILLCV